MIFSQVNTNDWIEGEGNVLENIISGLESFSPSIYKTGGTSRSLTWGE